MVLNSQLERHTALFQSLGQHQEAAFGFVPRELIMLALPAPGLRKRSLVRESSRL